MIWLAKKGVSGWDFFSPHISITLNKLQLVKRHEQLECGHRMCEQFINSHQSVTFVDLNNYI